MAQQIPTTGAYDEKCLEGYLGAEIVWKCPCLRGAWRVGPAHQAVPATHECCTSVSVTGLPVLGLCNTGVRARVLVEDTEPIDCWHCSLLEVVVQTAALQSGFLPYSCNQATGGLLPVAFIWCGRNTLKTFKTLLLIIRTPRRAPSLLLLSCRHGSSSPRLLPASSNGNQAAAADAAAQSDWSNTTQNNQEAEILF